MPPRDRPPAETPGTDISDARVAQLIGQLYTCGPATEQSRLLEHLLQPLGVLSLAAVANGIFAQFRLSTGWQDTHTRAEQAQQIRSNDVVALVNHVQQVQVEAVDGLLKILLSSPVMAGSAPAASLVSVLAQRTRARRAKSSGTIDPLSA